MSKSYKVNKGIRLGVVTFEKGLYQLIFFRLLATLNYVSFFIPSKFDFTLIKGIKRYQNVIGGEGGTF